MSKAASGESVAASPVRYAMRLKCILVVEDDEGLAELIAQSLAALNVPVHWVRTGQEAVAAVTRTPESLVLLDYSLPDMNASTLIETLARSQLAPPFIAITGHGDERVAVKLMKLGAQDYLIKDTQVLERLPRVVERVIRDIQTRGELQESERQRLQNERELSTIYDHIPTPILLLDQELKIIKANAAAVKMVGQPAARILDHRPGGLLDCAHVIENPRGCGFSRCCPECPLCACVVQTLETGEPHHQQEVAVTQLKSNTRSTHFFLVSTVRLELENRPVVLACMEDITERKKTEESMRESENRFRLAILEAPIPIMIHDEDDRVIQISKGWTHFSGYTHEEIPTVSAWLNHAYGAGSGPSKKYLSRLFEIEGTTQAGEWHIRDKSGTERIWDFQSTPIGRTPSGKRVLLSMAVDITQRKQSEAQLLRAQRMESVGRLSSGIAHDLNNVLAPILMVLPLLREDCPNEDVRNYLDTVEASANRGVNIVRQVLTFGRGMDSNSGPVQLRHLIKEMAQIIRETFPKSITLDGRCPTDLWVTIGDATQLHQVLMNLCLNARDAMPKGGVITLSAANLQLEEAREGMVGHILPGPYITVTITDTGTGIAPENLDKIFDPFFTTKEPGKGTGLGLSSVMGIVKGHGGAINVTSDLGCGTRFEIYLPATPDHEAAAPVAVEAMFPQGHGQTILLVDDEANIRKITSDVLLKNGYQVLTAADGSEGIALFNQHRNTIDLILTDYMMPKTDGLALALAVRKVDRVVKLVLSSGVSEKLDEARMPDLKAAGVAQVLVKPYSAQTLLTLLKEELGSSPN